MSKYQAKKIRNNRLGFIWIAIGGIIALTILVGLVGHGIYVQNLRPASADERTQIITIEQGSSVKQIARQLEDEKLIKKAWALELYSLKHGLGAKFQAGSYALNANAGTKSIVTTLTHGQVATRLVTIVPGRRIDQVRADLINDGFTPESVDSALQPDRYVDLPILGLKPSEVKTLEGLLWPDSYQRDATTDPTQIIRKSLTEMGERVNPELQAAFAAQNLSPYQGLVLASIIEQEVSKPEDRAQAAQVFLSRLKIDMVLGSDVTANYGAIAAGRNPSLTFDSPYNTLVNKGLPPSPISSISIGSLQAVAKPASTEWLYFVAGDDGITYFSKTFAEHEVLIEKHCFKLCGR